MDNKKLAACVVAYIILKRKKKINKKKCWVKPWISRRNELGAYGTLISELCIEDSQQFRNFFRMSAVQIQYIIDLVGPQILKKNTRMREAISVQQRVVVTLRFLASGDSFSSLQYLFRIPVCTMGRIVKEVVSAIYISLREEYIKFPRNTAEWIQKSKEFDQHWNFPHCIGAIDGKHVTIQAPRDSGSDYFNYKGFHSIVLLAIADANYKFIYLDVGCKGRISDGGVFHNCSLYNSLEQRTVKLPDPTSLPNRETPVPYCFVGDDAFPMKSYILKPYPFRNQPAPNRIFNYRLSRARRVVENSFGIIASKFRILRKPIPLFPNTATDIVLAICVLHNFLLTENDSRVNYLSSGLVDVENEITSEIIPGSWREDRLPDNAYCSLQKGMDRNYAVSQKEARDEFKEYFMTSDGEVSWQYKRI